MDEDLKKMNQVKGRKKEFTWVSELEIERTRRLSRNKKIKSRTTTTATIKTLKIWKKK